jgi:hypothetical protein
MGRFTNLGEVQYFIPGGAALCTLECQSFSREVINCNNKINGQLLKTLVLAGCLWFSELKNDSVEIQGDSSPSTKLANSSENTSKLQQAQQQLMAAGRQAFYLVT